MRHKGLIFGVSLGLGGLVFFLVWLVEAWFERNMTLAIACGTAVFTASLVLTGQAYWRGTRKLQDMLGRYRPDQVLYHDIAGLMEDGHERVGGLVVTTRRLVFETPPNLKGQTWQMEFDFSEIAMVKDHKGYFLMAAGGRENRFKVFNCEELVGIIQKAAAAVTRQRQDEKRTAEQAAKSTPPPQATQ